METRNKPFLNKKNELVKKCIKCLRTLDIKNFPVQSAKIFPIRYKARCRECQKNKLVCKICQTVFFSREKKVNCCSKSCANINRHNKKITLNKTTGELEKFCSKCKKTKPFYEFQQENEKPKTHCRQCVSEYQKKWFRSGGKEYLRDRYRNNLDVRRRTSQSQKKRRNLLSDDRKRALYEKHKPMILKGNRKRRALVYGCKSFPYTISDIIKKDGLQCYLCDKLLTKKQITLDHLIPLSRGGDDKAENIKICCRSCNCSKRAKTLTEFKKWRGDYNLLPL